MKQFDKQGREIPDSTEVEIPLRFKLMGSERDEMRRMIAEEMSRVAEQDGFESFEESDDFGEDDGDAVSIYELTEMQEDASMSVPAMVQDKGDGNGNGERQDGKPAVDGGAVGDGDKRVDDAGKKPEQADRGGRRRGSAGGVAAESGSGSGADE